ncbi:oxidoreductase [Celerinatantimonas sp. YJH-8]|uniref:oxidoreductase n=1 Tax=Celerinatantimonas sp. YJH-8 TaxID=3228714 RepID=UPI0038C1D317
MTTPIKTAIVGFGYSAKVFHIPFIQSLDAFEFSAISSRQHEEITNLYPSVQCFDSAEEMLKNSDAALVIITAPNNAHYPLAKLALENGKHVIIEKPFVTNSVQGQQLIEVANQHQQLLSVYHNRRWDSDFLTIKKLLAEGQLGELKWFESHMDRYRPNVRQRWREDASVEGSGILFDLGPHMIDQVVQLFGVPEKLTAQCLSMRDPSNPDDFFNIIFHYPDLLVHLHSNPYSPGSDNMRYKLLGTQAKFVKNGVDPQEDKLKSGSGYLQPGWTIDDQSQWGTLTREDSTQIIQPVEGGYENYYQGVADAINQGIPLPVTAEESLRVIQLIELVRESSRLNQTIEVKL